MKPQKIRFLLEHQGDGFPPVSEEYVWAIPTGHGSYIVDNVPFFVRDISLGDEITARNHHGELLFEKLLRLSKNSTIRLFVHDRSNESIVRKELEEFGCPIEGGLIKGMFAVSKPTDERTADILDWLDQS